jgi:hypothetical protein
MHGPMNVKFVFEYIIFLIQLLTHQILHIQIHLIAIDNIGYK